MVIVQANALSLRFDDWQLWHDLSFDVHAGELVHLKAANGRGKTSLLRGLMGLNHWLEGEVRWGSSLTDPDDFAAKVLFIGHKTPLTPDLSVSENLSLLFAIRGLNLAAAQLDQYLVDVGMDGYQHMPARLLSAGQSRRVALAQCLHPQSLFWCLDEPFVALDAQHVRWLVAQMQGLQRRGGAALFTSHQAIDHLNVRELLLD